MPAIMFTNHICCSINIAIVCTGLYQPEGNICACTRHGYNLGLASHMCAELVSGYLWRTCLVVPELQQITQTWPNNCTPRDLTWHVPMTFQHCKVGHVYVHVVYICLHVCTSVRSYIHPHTNVPHHNHTLTCHISHSQHT